MRLSRGLPPIDSGTQAGPPPIRMTWSNASAPSLP
jgi:hypothetical protein